MSNVMKVILGIVVGFGVGFNLMGGIYIAKGIPAPGTLTEQRTECQAELPRNQKCVPRVYWEIEDVK